MKTLHVRIEGTAPTIMNNAQGLDPKCVYNKPIKDITSKRSKNMTDSDIETLQKLEWCRGMYYDEEIGPYWPSENIESMLVAAAKKQMLGQKAKVAILCEQPKVAVIYEGPRKMEKLWEQGDFLDYRRVAMNKTRSVMRARPIFRSWALEFDLLIDDSEMNVTQVKDCLTTAGRLIGLSDHRPKYGRFQVMEMKEGKIAA